MLTHRLFFWLGTMVSLTFTEVARAQHLEAAGLSTSLAVTQTRVVPQIISLQAYTLDASVGGKRYDDIGYRVAAYGRWRLGRGPFFAQPELAYTSTSGQAYAVRYPAQGLPGWEGAFYYGHQIRRWEVAPLLGWRTHRRTYLLAGPVLAFNQREEMVPEGPSYPPSARIINSLSSTVLPVQLLAQVVVGYVAGRFDFNLRLEQSLTPYTRRGTFDGTLYNYEQHLRQGLLTAGFLLYHRAQVARPTEVQP